MNIYNIIWVCPKVFAYNANFFLRERDTILIMGKSKTSDQIQIKIHMPHPNQEPPASSKASNEDLKDMDVLCTFEIKIERIFFNMGVSKTIGRIQIKIKIQNSGQEPQMSSKLQIGT